MSTQDYENDAFLWETLDQAWANLSNDDGGDSTEDDDKPVQMPEASEKAKKRLRESTRKGKEKKDEEGASDHDDMHIWTERERRKKMRNLFTTLHSLLPQLPPKADKSTIVDEATTYIKSLQVTLQRLHKLKLERFQAGGGAITNPNSLSSGDQSTVAGTSQLAMLSTREAFKAEQVSSMNINGNGANCSNGNNSSAAMINTPSHLPVVIQTWTSSNVVLNVCGDDAQFLVYAPKKQGLLTSVCAVLEKHKIEVLSAHISVDANRCTYMIQARLAKGVADELSEVMTVEERFKQAGVEISMWVSA